MASLVQDVWLGWEARLRGRRLAPWTEAAVRLLFHLDPATTLDDAGVAALLDDLAARLEVVAWEPRGHGGSAGHFGAEVLDDARRLVAQGSSRWGERPVVVAGHGLGGWLALALASMPGVVGAVALAPSFAGAGREPSSPLRSALAAALARAPLSVPTLVVEGRDRPAADAAGVSEWVAREALASRVLATGGDASVLAPPWPGVVVAWAETAGTSARDQGSA